MKTRNDHGEERTLLEGTGTELYEWVVSHGPIGKDDPRVVKGGSHRDAFDQLVRLGLLAESEPGRWTAVDPVAVQSRVVAPLSQLGTEMLQESSQWATVFGTLAQSWRRAPGTARGPITELHGEAIESYIEGVVADAETELLTAQPQAGRNAQRLAMAAKRDRIALERGVKMRTLYQHSARRSVVTSRYVATLAALGAETRTLDEFFNRMIVIDRRLAIIPGEASLSVALAITEPSIVAYLVDIFDRFWERGRPFASNETKLVKDIAAEQRAMTIRMLIEGHADPTSAKRLGVSPRTYAGYISDLKAEYDVQTRFQLGYEMGRLGISGREADPPRGAAKK